MARVSMYLNFRRNTEEAFMFYRSVFGSKFSGGGVITMELQDMLWGAYYGSYTDKYGVQWMFNCNEINNLNHDGY